MRGRRRWMLVGMLALAVAMSTGCHRAAPRSHPAPMATFRPTPLPGRLNIGGLGLGVHAETLDPSLLWNRGTHQGIHAFEVDSGGLTRLVDGLPLQRGTRVIAAHGSRMRDVVAALGKPDTRVRGELRYDAPSRKERVIVEVDAGHRVEFARIQTRTP